MSRKAKAKPDPDRPGAFLPNGQSAKRGLNHALRSAGLAGIVEKLEYKTRLTGQNRLILVNPAYTSQTCSKCGYCDSRNRESQAVFECKQCHMSMNADLNAANNILERGLDHLIGLDEAEHAETESAVQPAYRGGGASTMTCRTSTRERVGIPVPQHREDFKDAGYKVSIAADGTVTVQQAPRRGDERAQG